MDTATFLDQIKYAHQKSVFEKFNAIIVAGAVSDDQNLFQLYVPPLHTPNNPPPPLTTRMHTLASRRGNYGFEYIADMEGFDGGAEPGKYYFLLGLGDDPFVVYSETGRVLVVVHLDGRLLWRSSR